MYNVIGYFKESRYLPECLVLCLQVSIDIMLDTMNGALVFSIAIYFQVHLTERMWHTIILCLIQTDFYYSLVLFIHKNWKTHK